VNARRNLTKNLAMLIGALMAISAVESNALRHHKIVRAEEILSTFGASEAAWKERQRQSGFDGSGAVAEPQAETDRRRAEANRIVDRALEHRVWGNEQATAIRPLLLKLPADARDTVLKRFVDSVNAQSLRLDVHGQPPI